MAGKKTPEKNTGTGRFLPGNNGGSGRPKGSRNKLGEKFIADVYDLWKTKGVEALESVIEDKPDVFVKVVASILPKELNINHDVLGELSMEELDNYANVLQSIIDDAARQSASDVEGGEQSARTTH